MTGDEFSSIYSADYSPSELEREPFQPEIYRYYVTQILTNDIIAELPFRDVSFGRKVSASGEFSGTLPAVDQLTLEGIDVYDATMPAARGLYVLRNDKCVWGGLIWNRSYSAADQSLSVSAATWESYLYRRYIWHSFRYSDGVDQTEVARHLINRMKNDFKYSVFSDENVTPWPEAANPHISNEHEISGHSQGELPFLREEMRSFGEALEELGDNMNGFEWNIDCHWNKFQERFGRRMNFRTGVPHLLPLGSKPPSDTEDDKPGIDTYLFEFPGNIIDVTLDEDADNACTRQFVVGGPPKEVQESDYKPIGSWNNDAYKGTDFVLLENVESSKHANTTSLRRLNRLATIYGRESAPPIRSWTVSVNGSMDPVIGSYPLGSWCRLIINDPFVEQSLERAGTEILGSGVIKRIMGWNVKIPDVPQYPEVVTLELEDDPILGFLPYEPNDPSRLPNPRAE